MSAEEGVGPVPRDADAADADVGRPLQVRSVRRRSFLPDVLQHSRNGCHR